LFPFSFSISLRQHQSSCPIHPDRVSTSSSSPESFFPNSLIPDVLRSIASFETNRPPLSHPLNSLSKSHSENLTAQSRGNASPVMNEVPPGTTTDD
jgi:hypothetical protein